MIDLHFDCPLKFPGICTNYNINLFCSSPSATGMMLSSSIRCRVGGSPRLFLMTSRHRNQSTTAHTLFNPSADSLTAHLSNHPPSPSSPLLYLLSTSIPSHHLNALIPTLQAIPNSIGSFSISPPNTEPTLSLATFSGGGARTFRTDLVGRPGAEVGRWQRPLPGGRWEEDRKGSVEGDLAGLKPGGGGWDEVWRAERGVDRLQELEGLA